MLLNTETAEGAELSVRDAYVEQPCVVSASTPVAMVAEKRIGSAIVAKDGKLVGILSRMRAER